MVLGLGGDEDHGHVGVVTLEVSRGLAAPHPLHADVHQHEIGLDLRDQVERFLAGAGLAGR